MKKLLVLSLLVLLAIPLFADDREKDKDRLQSASQVLDDVMSAPDKGIPEEILGDAKCLAVVPSLLKGGFIVGGAYGKGVASCKTEHGWSTPAFFRVEGGSFGLQIGGQAVDYIMVIMNDQGMQNLLSSKFKLGADASVAAGPVGRHAEGATDWKMRAEVLTYSRSRGVFAGITLNGAVIRQDQDDTRAFYGRMVPFKTLLTGEFTPTPADASPWLDALRKYAPAPAASAPAKTEPANPEKKQ
ncbi:MAG TPA: lipid-binding SYLF domain-containing protein [Terriglobales bacterium]|nr:lipid-binding SYLF domain-containing protein [Terriglobales bacterium]